LVISGSSIIFYCDTNYFGVVDSTPSVEIHEKVNIVSSSIDEFMCTTIIYI